MFLERKLSLCHSGNHKSYMDSLEFKLRPPRREIGGCGSAKFDLTNANSKTSETTVAPAQSLFRKLNFKEGRRYTEVIYIAANTITAISVL